MPGVYPGAQPRQSFRRSRARSPPRGGGERTEDSPRQSGPPQARMPGICPHNELPPPRPRLVVAAVARAVLSKIISMEAALQPPAPRAPAANPPCRQHHSCHPPSPVATIRQPPQRTHRQRPRLDPQLVVQLPDRRPLRPHRAAVRHVLRPVYLVRHHPVQGVAAARVRPHVREGDLRRTSRRVSERW